MEIWIGLTYVSTIKPPFVGFAMTFLIKYRMKSDPNIQYSTHQSTLVY